jgi:hypothetical protein
MSVLATASPALVPAIIGAIASVVSTALLAWVAVRAQGAGQQLDRIAKLLDIYADQIVREIKEHSEVVLDSGAFQRVIKRGLREVLGEHHQHRRRWYDNDQGD